MDYGSSVRLEAAYEEVVPVVKQALARQGFGVLTEIDMRATMKAKLDAEIEPYLIIGACNPPLAHKALGVDRSVGLLLPCNVVVRAVDDAVTLVEMLDPRTLVTVSELDQLSPVAQDAAQRLDSARSEIAAELAGNGAT